MATFPQLRALNVMKLHSAASAVLFAVIFNALVIVALIPLALRGREILRRRLRCHLASEHLDIQASAG